MWIAGKRPAHMTAKIVIASAERANEVRHFCGKQENRRDQRAGVADADPEDELVMSTPSHRAVQPQVPIRSRSRRSRAAPARGR